MYSEVNPFQPNVAFYIESSHLICSPNQMTGFYKKCNAGLKWVKSLFFKSNVKRNYEKCGLDVAYKIFWFGNNMQIFAGLKPYFCSYSPLHKTFQS